MAKVSDDDLIQIDRSVDTWAVRMTTASDFQRLQNAISTNLSKINSNTTDLENLVEKLGTPEDSEQLRDRYLRLQNDTKSLMQQVNVDLKKFLDAPMSAEDQRKRKNLADTFSKQYLALLNRFQKAQNQGARKEKESLERARTATYQPPGSFNDGFTSDDNRTQQQVVLPMEQNVDMNELKERDDQLRQLETNIVQVSELFKDVSRLVQEHGDIIDNIEQHTVETEKTVVQTNKELGAALVYRDAARRKKIILITVAIIVVAIIAIILVVYFSTRN